MCGGARTKHSHHCGRREDRPPRARRLAAQPDSADAREGRDAGEASARTPSWSSPISDARDLDRAPGKRPDADAWPPGTGSSAS